MKGLQKAVEEYLSMRRALGFKLKNTARSLFDFVAFYEKQGASHITIPLALQWVQCMPARPAEWARRLSCVRCFARYWSATDPKTQIPPWSLLPHRPSRARPYLYTDNEIRQLLEAAQRMGGLPGLTYYCLLGLLSVTGLRMSEVLNLRTKDVDLAQGVLAQQSRCLVPSFAKRTRLGGSSRVELPN